MMDQRRARTAAALGVLLLVALVAGEGSAAHRQSVRGSVLVATGGSLIAFNVASTCMLADATTNWAARVRLPCDRVPQPEACGLLAEGREGTLSFRFAVAQTTRGKPFTLTPAERAADLEIVFRGGALVHINSKDVRHPTGIESGIVPADATTAEVCLVMGVPTAFTYRAG